MRVLPIVAMLGCGSPMHAVDAPAADTAIPDAPVDAAAPVNRWTFNGKTYTSPTATCELPTGSPYWFVHSIAVGDVQQHQRHCDLPVAVINERDPQSGAARSRARRRARSRA